MTIQYGFHPTPFGVCLIGLTERGICSLSFHDRNAEKDALEEFHSRRPAARFTENPPVTAGVVRRIFESPRPADGPFHVLLSGTNFQVKIWQALLSIPPGVVAGYGDIASFIGAPKSVRAVGSAIAANPVAYLIPCHRVIAASGRIHGYHWKPERKCLMLIAGY